MDLNNVIPSRLIEGSHVKVDIVEISTYDMRSVAFFLVDER